jgi:hypothetical protein
MTGKGKVRRRDLFGRLDLGSRTPPVAPPNVPPSWPRWNANPKRGDKALVGNSGYRRFLGTVGDGHFVRLRRRVRAGYQHGVQSIGRHAVLQTALDRRTDFRPDKHLLATRPILHKIDETIRGHVFCSFLAFVLKAERRRIAALGQKGSWPAIIVDLEVEQDNRCFLLRSSANPPASRCARQLRCCPHRTGRRSS